jgi:hypothetical protein
MTRSTALVAVALLVLVALPVAAASPVIRAGIDPWRTVPEGTFSDFRENPLPAGFFCTASPAFTGRIWLRGVPLASDNPRLAKADTIVQRLDNAVFNKHGVARTRLQVRALQLEGIRTFKNVCGEYRVQVTLEGEQPVNNMRIVRENKDGGRFFVTLRINTKVIFTRVDNPAERLEFSQPVAFAQSPYHFWGFRDEHKARVGESMIDSDWDGSLDALVPGGSNFSAGHRGGQVKLEEAAQEGETVAHTGHLVQQV